MHSYYLNAPLWGDSGIKPPHTDANARVLKTEPVRNARVIHVKEGGVSYRDAVFGGTFALADYQSDNLDKLLGKFVYVQMLWYGQRLKTGCPEVLIDLTKAVVQIGYHGRVVSNVGQRKKKP
jgi:hypothetical protein